MIRESDAPGVPLGIRLARRQAALTPQKSASTGQKRREWLPWVAVGVSAFGVGCGALARMLYVINRDYGRVSS